MNAFELLTGSSRTALFGLAAAAALISGGCDDKKAPQPVSGSAPASESAASPGYVDTDFGFRVTPPSGFATSPPAAYKVPGKLLAAWAAGNGANIVAFVQEAGQPVTAKQLLDASAAAMKQAGCRIESEEVTSVSKIDVMSLRLVGPGTGIALGAGGTVQTYQHWIAIPKQNRVLVLIVTSPDASKTAPARAFEGMIAGLKVD